MTITTLKEQLTREEGERLVVYLDSLGILTVGIGHKVLPRDNLKLGDRITPEREHALFEADVAEHSRELLHVLPWAQALDVVRRDVLLDLCFNMGLPRLLKFYHMLAYMQDGDWKQAAAALKDSAAYHQEPKRITRLACQIETGERL